MADKPVIGIIGGSGLYEIDGLANTRWERVDTRLDRPRMNFCSAIWMDNS